MSATSQRVEQTEQRTPAPDAVRPPPRRRRTRKVKDDPAARGGPWWTFLAWLLTLIFFAPVAWMVLTSLHTEADAATNPPSIFAPLTLQNYGEVLDRGVGTSLANSAAASI